jgi:hypothetical protein
MQPIYTQTVGSGGAASITFNNIPQGFSDLIIQASARDSATYSPYVAGVVRFNGDSGANYSKTILYGNGSSASSSRTQGDTFLFFLDETSSSGVTANTFGVSTLTIPNYSGGSYKSCIIDTVTENNSSASELIPVAGLWRSTAPITSLTISAAVSFVQYSTFTLYGVSEQYAAQAATAPTIGTVTDQAGFASVAFTPASNDQAQVYKVVNGVDSTATYGSASPIVAPATVGASTTYTVQAVNDKGSAASSASSAITTANAYSSIATIYPSGTTSAIFTNIPQNYTHLQIRCFTKFGSAADLVGTFNGDNGSNYTYHGVYGDGANALNLSGAGGGQTHFYLGYNATNGTSYDVSIVDILDYSNTSKYKTVRSLHGVDVNGSGGFIMLSSGSWLNLSPVSSINLGGGTFSSYSQISLYGIA